MEVIKRFLNHGALLSSIPLTQEQEAKIANDISLFLEKKRYIVTEMIDTNNIDVYLYDELVFRILINDSTLKVDLKSENFFEPLIDVLEFIGTLGEDKASNQTLEKEEKLETINDLEEDEEDSDDWL